MKKLILLISLSLLFSFSLTSFAYAANTDPISRQEFTKVLVERLGLTLTKYQNTFKDVSAKNPYANYIAAAYTCDFISGTSPTTFEPERLITRAELAVMYAKALKAYNKYPKKLKPLTDFKDIKKIPFWAAKHVQGVYSAGIVGGRPSGNGYIYDSNANATSEENRVMVSRLKYILGQ